MPKERISGRGGSRPVAIAVNNGWNIVNYRAGLIRALQSAGHDVVVLAPVGPHEGSIRGLGARFVALPMNPRGTSPLSDAAVLGRFIRQLRLIRPSALLGFTAKPNIYGGLAGGMLGIPVINNISGLGSVFSRQDPLTGLVAWLYRMALKRSATVFFQNPDDRQLFLDRGLVRPDQAELLPGSGIDLIRFAPLPRTLRRRGSPFTFLFAGRLLWEKGVGEYVEAARQLRDAGLELRCQVLGITESSGLAAVPSSLIQDWAASGIIDDLGKADDVRDAFARADCIVLPSYYPEGLPRVLLEAGAMAIPTITTDTPGCRDAVDDGVTGLLCEPRSVASLRAAMERVMSMGERRRAAMGLAARAKMEREFAESIVHRAYLNALDKLTGTRE